MRYYGRKWIIISFVSSVGATLWFYKKSQDELNDIVSRLQIQSYSFLDVIKNFETKLFHRCVLIYTAKTIKHSFF